MLGYADFWVRVNLSNNSIQRLEVSDEVLRTYLGGTGIGAKFLYDLVKPGTAWDHPDNCVILATGPLNGTNLAGSGSFSVVSKGPLTNGAASSQASGYFGTFLKTSGFDGIVLEGMSDNWVYLYFHDGMVEIRDAERFKGLDSLTVEQKIKEELGKPSHQSSVYSIGPAGENLVRFAALVGDGGHVAAHNGIGAVLGKKKIKAIAVERGKYKTAHYDGEKTKLLARQIVSRTKEHPVYGDTYKFGTSHLLGRYTKNGLLPVRNLTTSIVDDKYLKLTGEYYRSRFKLKLTPCWACSLQHCHQVTVTEGPYAGLVAEEPEYELFAGFGSMIGQDDPGAVVMLNDLCDRLGMDGNEASWLTAFVMECFDKGILKLNDLDGIDLKWGNAEAVKTLFNMIAKREGIGDILAEGVMRAAQSLGEEAMKLAVYIGKGHAPRGHDHRVRWFEMLDNATSNVGTIESTGIAEKNPFSPQEVARDVAKAKSRNFVDSLVVCMFPSMTMLNTDVSHLIEILNSVTGWDYTSEEAADMSMRVVNLLRVFNIRHGLTPVLEYPSYRYGSMPVDGPAEGVNVMEVWDLMLEEYYRNMGWDQQTGKPFPETLCKYGLDSIISDIY